MAEMRNYSTLFAILLTLWKTGEPELISMKIVDEPSSYGLNNAVGNLYGGQFSDTLKMKVKPANFSGPPHFTRMKGNCYSNILNEYKYELCPFSNVTQYEQSLRWNPYSGILGVWQEWEIENNTFVAMVMKNGDSCNDRNREVKVFFKCGRKTEILNVTEPSTCWYHLILQTPLVCPTDSMLVYPVLSKEHQLEWDEIETRFFHMELTNKGYNKKLQKLFENAGFYVSEEKKKLLEVKPEEIVSGVKIDINSRFQTQVKCEKEYEKLEKENERLKKLLSEKNIDFEVHSKENNANELNMTSVQNKDMKKVNISSNDMVKNNNNLSSHYDKNIKNKNPLLQKVKKVVETVDHDVNTLNKSLLIGNDLN